MALLFAAAAACIILFVIIAVTMRAQQAVRLCSLLSLVILLLVPINRLSGEVMSLRNLVPLAVAALTVIAVIRSRRVSVRAWFWIGLYVVASGVVTVGSSSDTSGVLLWILGAFTVATGVLQGAALKASNSVAWFTRAFVLVACALALYGVYEVFARAEPLWRGALILPSGQSTTLSHPFLDGFARAQASFGHPLPFALVIVLAIALALTSQVNHKLGRLMVMAALTAGLVATGSRNALVLSAVLVLYLGVRRFQAFRVPGYLALFIAAVAALILFLDSDVVATGSFTHRIGALESIGRLITERNFIEVIFGSGAGGTPELFSRGLLQADGLQAIDNQYIHTLATDGLLGLSLLVGAWVAAFRLADSRWKIVLVLLAAEGMIFDFLAWPTTGYLAWLIIGIALTRSKPPADSPTRGRRGQGAQSTAHGSVGLSLGTR